MSSRHRKFCESWGKNAMLVNSFSQSSAIQTCPNVPAPTSSPAPCAGWVLELLSKIGPLSFEKPLWLVYNFESPVALLPSISLIPRSRNLPSVRRPSDPWLWLLLSTQCSCCETDPGLLNTVDYLSKTVEDLTATELWDTRAYIIWIIFWHQSLEFTWIFMGGGGWLSSNHKWIVYHY